MATHTSLRHTYQQFIKTGLTPMDLTAFPDEDRTCAICHEGYTADVGGCLPVKLPCSHIIGNSCLRAWLAPTSGHNSCPLCRKKLFEIPLVASSLGEFPGSLASVTRDRYNGITLNGDDFAFLGDDRGFSRHLVTAFQRFTVEALLHNFSAPMWEFQARLEARYSAFFREDAARPESSETMNLNSARVAVLRHALATGSEGTGGDEQAPQFQQDLTYQRSRIQRLLAALREDPELVSRYLGLPPGQENVPVSAHVQRSTRVALSFLGDNRTFPAQLFVTIQRHGVEAVLQNEFNLFGNV
ncbi:hypothetical protein BJ546DRAFT_638771 [Cryomyces antarcticus]|uniref:RING-type domain-containing protein n=1 Tax=Cryomyces antarcticus TaxID=329879 RepID=A0ABR0MAA2_9PEZI|nr:hypothetical protein LTR39_003857 [Cryomyces antarcticus]KAK5018851.1 hypothetical protein LTR60_001323 [Cryomyces antarcticus]KAK5291717.1 hypothetical protein LTR16_002117 [Cryomyces antarcticus]